MVSKADVVGLVLWLLQLGIVLFLVRGTKTR